jgi:hypothetical protein
MRRLPAACSRRAVLAALASVSGVGFEEQRRGGYSGGQREIAHRCGFRDRAEAAARQHDQRRRAVAVERDGKLHPAAHPFAG